jgi:hypothetical protein
MGEIDRAHDTKLGRDVALKIVSPASAGDPERVSRGARPRHSQPHPNIVTIHTVEHVVSAMVPSRVTVEIELEPAWPEGDVRDSRRRQLISSAPTVSAPRPSSER